MTFIISCVIFAALLPMLTKTPLAIAQSKQPGGYDNHYPRAQQVSLEGPRAAGSGCPQQRLRGFPPIYRQCPPGPVGASTGHRCRPCAWCFLSPVCYTLSFISSTSTCCGP